MKRSEIHTCKLGEIQPLIPPTITESEKLRFSLRPAKAGRFKDMPLASQ